LDVLVVTAAVRAIDVKNPSCYLPVFVAFLPAITTCMHMYWALLYTYAVLWFHVTFLPEIASKRKTLVSRAVALARFLLGHPLSHTA
jgi:hypothetical protein